MLTPPNGNPASATLLALFLSAVTWNVATWRLQAADQAAPPIRKHGDDEKDPVVRAGRIGKRHLTPSQGASADRRGRFFRIAGPHDAYHGVRHCGDHGGVQRRLAGHIAIAWVATLPATIILSGGLFWLLSAG